ncbi:MAG: type II toxin-antitoxin system HicA family toxin [Chloroflexota bacterium]|nr:type II toxin-antitoxin system HicA family toxin [Chloroflexota bacterium]
MRFRELRRLLEAYGWDLVRIKGSHHTFVHYDGRGFVVPLRRPHVRSAYVREALKRCQ